MRELRLTEVGDLETGRLELGDTEHVLEVLVEHIKETVGKTLYREGRREGWSARRVGGRQDRDGREAEA